MDSLTLEKDTIKTRRTTLKIKKCILVCFNVLSSVLLDTKKSTTTTNCNYFHVHHILSDKFCHTHFQYKVLHLNIQGLSSKFDQLKMLLSQLSYAHVEVDYILLRETFLKHDVVHLLKLPSMVKDMCYDFIWRLNSLSANFGFVI